MTEARIVVIDNKIFKVLVRCTEKSFSSETLLQNYLFERKTDVIPTVLRYSVDSHIEFNILLLKKLMINMI